MHKYTELNQHLRQLLHLVLCRVLLLLADFVFDSSIALKAYCY
jgi:hypothetical protein